MRHATEEVGLHRREPMEIVSLGSHARVEQ